MAVLPGVTMHRVVSRGGGGVAQSRGCLGRLDGIISTRDSAEGPITLLTLIMIDDVLIQMFMFEAVR